MTAEQLHEEGLKIAQTYQETDYELIQVIQESRRQKSYLKYNYASVRSYAIEKWQIPEDKVSDAITILNKNLPEMIEALKQRKATISKLRKVCPVITKENAKHWLTIVATKSSREIEKAVAKERPETQIKERMVYRAENLSELTMPVSDEFRVQIERSQDILAQKQRRHVSYSEALQYNTVLMLEKEDPIRKAQRAQARNKATPPENPVPGRRPQPASMKHALQLRDQGQCTHLNSDKCRCPHKRWLDVHHVVPLEKGGSNKIENLTTLCWTHHHALHQR